MDSITGLAAKSQIKITAHRFLIGSGQRAQPDGTARIFFDQARQKAAAVLSPVHDAHPIAILDFRVHCIQQARVQRAEGIGQEPLPRALTVDVIGHIGKRLQGTFPPDIEFCKGIRASERGQVDLLPLRNQPGAEISKAVIRAEGFDQGRSLPQPRHIGYGAVLHHDAIKLAQLLV